MTIKQLILLLSVLFLFQTNKAISQNSKASSKVSFTESGNLFITTNKTTSLVFPFPIKSVDRGSQDVLARQVEGVENILQVKAARENLQETNLTVITADGNLYSFLVNYNINPPDLILTFSEDSAEIKSPSHARLKNRSNKEADVISTGNTLLNVTKRPIWGVADRESGTVLKLRGIYIRNDVMFFQLECKNHSNIDYDVDMLRFITKSFYKSKRTAVQELEIKPTAKFGNVTTIEAGKSKTFVVAVPKFTLPYARYLSISMNEKNGGRQLQLNVRNHIILLAESLDSN